MGAPPRCIYISPMSHALIPFKKQIKYNVINENKIKICWNQLDFISANFALISHLDYLQELRWRDLIISLTLCYFYWRFGKTGNKKPTTFFATLLHNELNSDVTWFITALPVFIYSFWNSSSLRDFKIVKRIGPNSGHFYVSKQKCVFSYKSTIK